ncbi:hypothetical protein [Nocardia carnea]|uniref:hypothetical protein n=1 Tax=Nocardia carnea TaxID=37328 RepID=UPI0024578787|nr:hypothetical protein [Nocardia carnea]
MSWRYDVYTCHNQSTDIGAHDRPCSGSRWVAEFHDRDWARAFLLAEMQPHGAVIRTFTGAAPWATGSTANVFEHRAGGGLCRGCGARRGPLITTDHGNQFLCGTCVTGYRRSTHSTTLLGEPATYVRVIDRAIDHATRTGAASYRDLLDTVLNGAGR